MVNAENGRRYTFDTELSEERDAYITNQLIAYNKVQSPNSADSHQAIYTAAPLHIFVLDETHNVVGGLVGRTHALKEWLEVSILWVAHDWRGQGLGRQLMTRAEAEARKRGCRYARLATSDYQAPDFYQKLGYIMYGRLENCPPGETVTYFRKDI